MTTRHLHVFSIDGPGQIWSTDGDTGTGWVWLTVPRAAIFGSQPAEVTEWDYDLLHGTLPAMASQVARKVREIQSLDYKTGAAIVTDDTAVSFCGMLKLLQHQKLMGDSTLHMQPRLGAKRITDDSLKKLGMYVDQDNIRMATKHALALLRRAKKNRAFAHELWPYPASGLP